MSLPCSQVPKSIQNFLQLNGLINTLSVFKQELHSLYSPHQFQSPKPLKSRPHIDSTPAKHLNGQRNTFMTKKQSYHLSKLSLQKIDYHNSQCETLLREHLQKVDEKTLRKAIKKLKKNHNYFPQRNFNQENSKASQQTDNIQKLTTMPFFKKLLSCQNEKYLLSKLEKQKLSQRNPFLEQSRQQVNQWDDPEEQGFSVNEFDQQQLPQVRRELLAIRDSAQIRVLREKSEPKVYFARIAEYKERSQLNIHDKYFSRLPSKVRFSCASQLETRQTEQSVYPLQVDGVVYDSYDLILIYNRDKTGFEEHRDLKIVINEVLAGRYQVVSYLGQAQFSTAIEVKDLYTQRRHCLKVIQNNKEYLDQSIDQIKILRYIKANCNPQEAHLLDLQGYFYHREHLMIMTELLKDTLLHAYQMHRSLFSNLRTVQIITKQILQALEQLHSLHIAHTDLKPQNIMIKSYTARSIKVIDLGSSTFFHDEPTYYVQTRSYRAPQVILGIPYDGRIDIWSLGCIVAEMFTGQVLFNAESESSLLALMQGLRGPWPSWMFEKGSLIKKYFSDDLFIYKKLPEERSRPAKIQIYTPKITTMKARVGSENKNFLDFLSKCLKLDPSQRMSASQGLKHPFITETIPQ